MTRPMDATGSTGGHGQQAATTALDGPFGPPTSPLGKRLRVSHSAHSPYDYNRKEED